MKRTVLLGVLVGLVSIPFATGARAELKDEDDRVSYSVGYQMGGDFKRQNLNIKPDAFLLGIQDALNASEPQMSPADMQQTLVELKQRVMAAQQTQRQQAGEENLAVGKKFLAENANKEGVETTASGLQYEVLAAGEGAAPSATSTVTVHYRGTLIDGTEFDSSYSRGQPATFALNRVIKGWTEGVQLMKPGAKYRFYIPSDLAYGERGAGAQIGPHSTLIFDVELIEVK